MSDKITEAAVKQTTWLCDRWKGTALPGYMPEIRAEFERILRAELKPLLDAVEKAHGDLLEACYLEERQQKYRAARLATALQGWRKD